MTEKITIERLFRNTTDREGRALLNSKGVPYAKLTVIDSTGRDIRLSDWNNLTSNWNVGTVVELTIDPKTKKGEEFRNKKGEIIYWATIPNVSNKYNERIDELERRLEYVEALLKGKSSPVDKYSGFLESTVPVKDDSELPF